MSGHLFQNSNGKSRCSATRRSGFSQGKYKGNGSSLVICFKGAEPLRRACSANGPSGRPAAARLSCRLSMGYVFSISDRPTKSFSICTSPKGTCPLSYLGPVWKITLQYAGRFCPLLFLPHLWQKLPVLPQPLQTGSPMAALLRLPPVLSLGCVQCTRCILPFHSGWSLPEYPRAAWF